MSVSCAVFGLSVIVVYTRSILEIGFVKNGNQKTYSTKSEKDMIKACWSRLIGHYPYTDNHGNFCYVHNWPTNFAVKVDGVLFQGESLLQLKPPVGSTTFYRTQEDWDKTLHLLITSVINRFFKVNFASKCIINQRYQMPSGELLFGPNKLRLSLRASTKVQPLIEEYNKFQPYSSIFKVANIIECNRSSSNIIDVLYDDEVGAQITLLDLHLAKLD